MRRLNTAERLRGSGGMVIFGRGSAVALDRLCLDDEAPQACEVDLLSIKWMLRSYLEAFCLPEDSTVRALEGYYSRRLS